MRIIHTTLIRQACALLLEYLKPEQRIEILKKLLKEAQEETKKPQPSDPRQIDWTKNDKNI